MMIKKTTRKLPLSSSQIHLWFRMPIVFLMIVSLFSTVSAQEAETTTKLDSKFKKVDCANSNKTEYGFCKGLVSESIQITGAASPKLSNDTKSIMIALERYHPSCGLAYRQYYCNYHFPKCNEENQSLQLLCSESCRILKRRCRPLIEKARKMNIEAFESVFINCQDNALSSIKDPFVDYRIEDTCFNVTVAPPISNDTFCPSPLIKYPNETSKISEKTLIQNMERKLSYCNKDLECCLPCSATTAFYPPDSFKKVFVYLSGVRVISFISIFFVLVSYLVLPGRRQFPRNIIIWLSLVMIVWQAATFSSFDRNKSLACVDEYTMSAQDNNIFCAVQGGVMIYASIAAIIWVLILVLIIHMQVVWWSGFPRTYVWLLHICAWLIPALFTGIAYYRNSIRYYVGSICLVSLEYINIVYFGPLMALLVLSSFLFTWTVAYMLLSVRQEKKCTRICNKIRSKFGWKLFPTKNQFYKKRKISGAASTLGRLFFFGLCMMILIVGMFIFYHRDIGNLMESIKMKIQYADRNDPNSNNTFQKWLLCIASGSRDLASCQIEFQRERKIPRNAKIALIESWMSMGGLSFFLAFFIGGSLWKEWYQYYLDKQQRKKDEWKVNAIKPTSLNDIPKYSPPAPVHLTKDAI